MYRLLLIGVWLGSSIYAAIPFFWFAAHPFAERWRRSGRSPYPVLLPVWMAGAVLLLALSWPWHSLQLYTSALAWLAAAPFFASALLLYRGGMRGFSSAQLAGVPELAGGRHSQALSTSGIRNRMRHPIYLAHLLNLLGAAIGSGLIVIYGFVVFAALADIWLVRAEDRELEARFGEPYRQYKARVPAFGIRMTRPTDHRPLATGHSQ